MSLLYTNKFSIRVGRKVEKNRKQIKVTTNGPYIVSGDVPLFDMTIQCDSKGTPAKWVKDKTFPTTETYSLCRCGKSQNKPFCDSTHIKVDFDGTEVSDNQPFNEMAKTIDGPALRLKDAEILCASARFCHRGGDIWDQIPQSKNPQVKNNCINNSFDCPSGRLVVVEEESGQTLEPILEKSIAVINDPGVVDDVAPLWVRGGIPIYSAEGKLYEVRNRVTLCRCGKSTNKPFCDSSHYPEEDREVK
jgi:CDGSH-type Zn-finger protein